MNQDLLFFYYGTWFKSGPIDIGRTTITALKSFIYDTHCINSKRNFQCGVYKIIKTLNSESLSNGFLMRISPFVAWYYYRNKRNILSVFSSKEGTKYEELYLSIKTNVTLDNQLTHSNPEVYVSSAVFVFMALSAMCDYNHTAILEQVKLLLEQKSFNEGYECSVKDIIKGYLEMFAKPEFNKETFYKSISIKSIGYYVHAFKLTLYFLYFFDSFKDTEEYTKYRVIMNIICNCGGDTDTNAAIVGCVIGPLIGFDNFGRDIVTLLLYSPKNRVMYTNAMIYFYINYLKEDNKEESECRFNFYRGLMTLLNIEIE